LIENFKRIDTILEDSDQQKREERLQTSKAMKNEFKLFERLIVGDEINGAIKEAKDGSRNFIEQFQPDVGSGLRAAR